MTFVDFVKDFFDGLIDFLGMFCRHGTLEDTDSSDVLIDNSFEVFTLPERIAFKPTLEILVENGNEWHGFLNKSTAEEKEMFDILRIHQLLTRFGIRFENLLADRVRIFEF